MLMRSAAAVLTLTLLGATPLIAVALKLDLKLSKQEWISAAQVDDDASGAIVVAQTKPRATRLVRFHANGESATTRLEGMAVNHFEALPDAGPDRYLIAGSIDADGDGRYVHRIVEWKDNSLRTLWDSTQLPPRALDSDPYIRVSADGRLWATVAQRNGTLRFTWGEVAQAAPRATMTVESARVELPEHFVFDGTDVVFVRSKGNQSVAAVLWTGRVYLFDLATGSVAAVLAPPAGGATLMFDRRHDTLWVGGNEWAAFPIGSALRDGNRGHAQTPAQIKTRDVATPLAGGPVVADASRQAFVRVSPGGHAVLVANDGPLGSIVEIRKNR
jgi:hypothetical protein